MTKPTLLPCPFCGQTPQHVKHFREPLWRLIHRCKVIGPVSINWTDDPQKSADTWNTRHKPKPMTK